MSIPGLYELIQDLSARGHIAWAFDGLAHTPARVDRTAQREVMRHMLKHSVTRSVAKTVLKGLGVSDET